MKKTLLVAAMMASFTGAAVAQNSVTLYGRFAPAVVYQSIDADAKAASTLNVTSRTARQFAPADGYAPGGSLWGIKGTEDLGNGLKVSFQLENGFSTQDGVQNATSASDRITAGARISTLTVSNSSWGSIGYGKDFTAGSTILAGISPLGVAYGFGSAQTAFGVFSLNVANQVKYLSPSFNGIRFGASYAFSGSSVRANGAKVNETSFGTSNKNRLMEAGLRYANGPIVAAATYTQINPNGNDTTIDKNVKNWVIGGTYDLKMVKLHAAYGQNIDGIISGTTSIPGLGGGANFGNIGAGSLIASGRTNQYMLGLSAPVGAAGIVLFNFSQLSPGGDFDTSNTATQTNLGLAYTYSMSKRTSLYASYSYARNFALIDGVTINQVGAGIVHTF